MYGILLIMLRALETSELEEWTNEEKVCDSVAEEVALKQAIERKGGVRGCCSV